MREKKNIIKDVKEVRSILKKYPDAIEFLSPFQQEVIQALMRNYEGNTAAMEREE